MSNKNDSYVVVIGAANIDIGGTPANPLIPADSNPGDITITHGGVARNIAHNLCKLGVPVKFITAIGGDVLGAEMIRQCEELGMDTSCVLKIPEENSSMYLYINNDSGDMELSIDHMTICSRITPRYIETLSDTIKNAAAIVLDTNIPTETFSKIKELSDAPIYVDPVSTALSIRVKPVLEGIDTIKPNTLEAEYLTDMTIKTEADYRAAATAILDMGVKRVFMSMGPEGMLAAERKNGKYKMYIVDEYPADVVCTTGAGDSATAAIVWASTVIADEDSIVTAAKAANVVAAMTVSVQETNNPDLCHKDAFEKLINSNISVREI